MGSGFKSVMGPESTHLGPQTLVSRPRGRGHGLREGLFRGYFSRFWHHFTAASWSRGGVNLGRCGHCLGVVLALVLRAEERPDRCKFVVSSFYLDFSEGTFSETCTICPPDAAEQVVQNGEKVPPEKWSWHLYSRLAHFPLEMQRGDFRARVLRLAEGTIREVCTVAPPELGLEVVRRRTRQNIPESSYDYKVTIDGRRDGAGLTLAAPPAHVLQPGCR